ncbi:hypothetical protein SO802_004284 [Lithocarpus litseifolius]|uniref:RNase H type-1 domain-containing protein n=1 Tax=Lithocarpus litseifolius TaxID=425828 RepID=A0AAW2E6F7_9ROSI
MILHTLLSPSPFILDFVKKSTPFQTLFSSIFVRIGHHLRSYYDSHGKLLASLVEKIKVPSSSDEVEVLAAVRAITLAMDLNLPSFIVKGDSEVVISALRKEEESFSSFGQLISSIKHYLVSCKTALIVAMVG